MEKQEIFAKRLRNARLMKRYSMADLAAAMDISISKMAISKYENSESLPSSSVLIALSHALEQPIDYFFRPFEFHVDSIKFRKYSTKLGKKEEKSIKESIYDLIERYMNIEEICNTNVKFYSPIDGIITSKEQVKQAALSLRSEWNIGNDGIVNVISLLEEHGIKILEIDAPESFDGLSSMVNECYPVIVINRKDSSERKRFTVLHELGHLILNFDVAVSEKEEEKFCNLFANEFLIPESVFKKELGESRRYITLPELKSLQRRFGVSCDALMYKAKDCGIIKEKNYIGFLKEKGREAEFKAIIEESIYPKEESFRFISLVYKALSSELITISKAANLLNQSVEQVRKELAYI